MPEKVELSNPLHFSAEKKKETIFIEKMALESISGKLSDNDKLVIETADTNDQSIANTADETDIGHNEDDENSYKDDNNDENDSDEDDSDEDDSDEDDSDEDESDEDDNNE